MGASERSLLGSQKLDPKKDIMRAPSGSAARCLPVGELTAGRLRHSWSCNRDKKFMLEHLCSRRFGVGVVQGLSG